MLVLPIDEKPVEFWAATARGLHAAAADLTAGQVTLSGSGELDGLALRTVTDPSPYLKR
jgi:hypothetical protein